VVTVVAAMEAVVVETTAVDAAVTAATVGDAKPA
jgi:hypothetical protein